MHTVSPHPALPVSLHVAGKKVVVVGDGDLAAERATRLASAGADVETVPGSGFTSDVARGAFAVLAVTGDNDLDADIAGAARTHGALAYAHDQPGASDFAMPAVASRGPLKLAVSTDGTAPALAARLRELLDAALAQAGAALDDLIRELAAARSSVPPGRRDRLRRLAQRLQLRGHFEVDPDSGGTGA